MVVCPQLKELLRAGELISLTSEKIKDTIDDDGTQIKQRVNDYIVVLVYNHFVDKNKIREASFVKKRCDPPLSESELKQAKEMADTKIKELQTLERAAVASTPEAQLLNYQHIADNIRKRHNILAYLGVIYKYVDGVYVDDKEGLIDSEIISELVKVDEFEMDDDITKAAHQVKHYLKFEMPEKEYPFNKVRGTFNVANGVIKVDLSTGDHELLPHSPEYKFNYKLKVEYNEDASIEPILKYIESLGVEIKELLIQIPAHCLLSMDGQVFKKAYFLKGGQDCGKSTYTQMLAERFFGLPVCSSLSLQELLFDKFKRANLEGKLLNYRGDLPSSKVSDTGTFKMLTGGDGVNIERKGIQAQDNFINKAVFVFSANNYPQIVVPEDGGAFWDRWIPIPMNNHFESDPLFSDKTFTPENMSGLLNLVLMTMPSLLKEGIKTNGGIMKDWMKDADSSYEYISNNIERCDQAVIIKGTLFQDYIRYCGDNELSSVDIKVFTKAMRSFGYRVDSQFTINKRREHCYSDCKKKSEPFGTFPDGVTTVDISGIVNQPAQKTFEQSNT